MSTEATCTVCGFDFVYDAAFFKARNLAAPRRCLSCREARRTARRVETHGRVSSVGLHFSVLRSDDGQEFFCGGPLPPALRLGDRVSFTAIMETPGQNHRPRAFDPVPEP